ncbi:Rieske Fe-S protein [Deinobacterium chartae]|uniref:Rieske Fe-S protein n=1 Tax=Deinobacterium chartae TaxID=521158 RepID=A0A841I184_9DEIO|nr:ubiquinol-cytochrome c reductase iron-sulfur subunit [Deinobacterium chartae]MBB6098190.1 Rieske Fe-S protein [Deinobacterium chartae]
MKFSRRKLLEYWWTVPVAATLGGLGFMAHYATRVTFGKTRAGTPRYLSGHPLRVARAEDLSEVWASRDFSYTVEGRSVPCVLLRLPEATATSLAVRGAHFAAFSRVCTHLGCSVLPVRDLEAVALTYNYRSDHPVLGCPCHFSVFDPLRQGESVFGKALYPLPRVRLEVRGEWIVATGLEPAPSGQGV